MELGQLFHLAAGLNIEGGYPLLDLLKTNPKGKWINLILVLDRPLVDNITFDELFSNNKYPLLENAIDNLNENHFLASYLMIIGYYIDNGHQICCKNETEYLNITIHLHQDTASTPLLNLLKSYVEVVIKDNGLEHKKIKINYLTDEKTYVCSDHNYDDTDLLISLSQCAGLHPNLMPGSLIIPNQFIPYQIHDNIIYESLSYEMPNLLKKDLENVLFSKFNNYSVKYINDNYVSANPNKKFLAKEFTKNDFNVTNILQVDELWNPTNPKVLVKIE
ncbi:hypothetical protein QJ856_gp0495 [Tupanvirus deep ocean]|uniref:Uncharacterized protein n=2 Tax=Tupanvirus TaxID=2094720 RepID=A0AC62A960_9VIRU|nr:hypothetical protein QJ856_gp0495 [Tupanvirus deep ocean]QKU34249.1 hypothetical protein [Tupanvirus deep ocean]